MIIVIISMIMLYTFPQIGLWLPTQVYKSARVKLRIPAESDRWSC